MSSGARHWIAAACFGLLAACGSGTIIILASGGGGGGSGGILNQLPLLSLDSGAFSANPDSRRGIALPFRLSDPEGDPVEAVFQWRLDGESFPALPSNSTDLRAALADPARRRELNIASERVVFVSGGARITGAGNLLLDQNLRRFPASPLGLELEVLRPRLVARSASGDWITNELRSPRAARFAPSGLEAVVLDASTANSWSLLEIELASGAVQATLVLDGAGRPRALARLGDGWLVALAGASGWELQLVTEDGNSERVAFDNGLSVSGDIQGLALLGEHSALITVADALIQVALDGSGEQKIIKSGLAGPTGMALDPRNPGWLYLAEREAPTGDAGVGRVIHLELGTGNSTILEVDAEGALSSGGGLPRSERLRIDAELGVLYALGDSDDLDGLRELRAFSLDGEKMRTRVVATVPAGVVDLDTVDGGASLMAAPAAADLLLLGGVEAAGRIVAYDPLTGAVELNPGLPAPLLRSANRSVAVRIKDRATRILDSNGMPDSEFRFVWDSGDLPQGGSVVLRASPFDNVLGAPVDTGNPRAIGSEFDQGLELLPRAAMSAPSCALLTDLDGDGDDDLAGTESGSGAIAVYLIDGGVLGSAPDQLLNTSAPDSAPIDLVANDFNGDGKRDLAAAAAGSEDLRVFTQTGSGNFAQAPTILEPVGPMVGDDEPRSLATGDLNGDGSADLICANVASGDLASFLQVGNVLPSQASSVFGGGGGTLEPVDLALADLDLDGQLDAITANRAGNDLSFFSGARGDGVSIGASGVTDAPTAVVVGDWNADGLPDLGCASSTDGSVRLIAATAPAQFDLGQVQILTAPSLSAPQSNCSLVATELGDGPGVDLIVTHASSERALVWFGRGNGQFQSSPMVLGGGVPGCAASGDVNGDGRRDLVLPFAAGSAFADGYAVSRQSQRSSLPQQPSHTLGGLTETRGMTGLVPADLDGDGDFDLAAACEVGQRIALYEQASSGVFDELPTLLGNDQDTAGAIDLVAADFNGDGRVDLVSANRLGGNLAHFVGTEVGFDAVPTQLLGSGASTSLPVAVAAGDLDGDGDLELVSANANDLTIFVRDARTGFPAVPTQALGGSGATDSLSQLVIGDRNGDGRDDLIAASLSGAAYFFHQSFSAPDAMGSLSEMPDAELALAIFTDHLVLGDLDGDGDGDLIAGSSANAEIAWIPGGAGAAAVEFTLSDATSGLAGLCLGDMDGDQRLDLVVSESITQRVAIFSQAIAGGFPSVPTLRVGGPGASPMPAAVLVFDFDRDGDLDLVTAENSGDTLSLFFGAH